MDEADAAAWEEEETPLNWSSSSREEETRVDCSFSHSLFDIRRAAMVGGPESGSLLISVWLALSK